MSAAQGIGLGEQQQTEDEGKGGGPTGPSRAGRFRGTPYLLLLPGMAWLAIFFLVPLVTLLSTSTQTRPEGAEIGVYTQTFTFSNYPETLSEYAATFGRSFLYAFIATVLALAISLPAGLRDRVQGRAMAQPAAGPGRRTVLRQLPAADRRLEADPGRRAAGWCPHCSSCT